MSHREIIIRPVKSEDELTQMYHVRWLVLRKPLGKEKGSEQDQYDRESFHLIALWEAQIIGCVRLRSLSQTRGSISYVAVLPEFQHQRIGSRMMKKIIEQAKKENLKTLTLNSRFYCVDFYKKLGFVEAGESLYIVGILHIPMKIHI